MATVNPPESRWRLSRLQWAIFALILVAGGICRFVKISQPSLWMDEIWSIEISTGRGSAHANLQPGIIHQDQIDLTSLNGAPPWYRIWPEMVNVPGHPPLYHIVLRWWMALFGIGETSTRALSALASMMAILVFFDICRLLHGTSSALWSAAIMALALGQLEFAQQARSYALLILFALAAADALVRIKYFNINWPRMASLILFAAATALTHYFSAGLLIAPGLYALLALGGKTRWKACIGLIIAAALVAALWGPWIGAQVRNIPKAAPGWVMENSTTHIQYTFERLIGLPAIYLFGAEYLDATPFVLLTMVSTLVLLAPWVRLVRRPDLLLWCLWFTGTIGLVTAIDFTHPTDYLKFIRYTILASPAIYALLGSFNLPKGKPLGQLVPAATVILLAILSCIRVHRGAPTLEDWRLLATSLDQDVGPNDLLVYHGNDAWIPPGMWYLGIQYYMPESHRPWLILKSPPSRELMAELQPYRSIWVIGRDPTGDGRAILPGWQVKVEMPRTSAGTFTHFVRVGTTATTTPATRP